MKECIDIFSRLLIATITFVVPILINLLSTFSAGERRRMLLAADTEEEIGKKILEEVANNPGDIKTTVSLSNKKYKEIDKKTKAELRRMNPIIQFWLIFSFLVFSLLCLFFYYLIKANTWGLQNYLSPTLCLSISGLAYILALFFIIRILYTIIQTRRIIEN